LQTEAPLHPAVLHFQGTCCTWQSWQLLDSCRRSLLPPPLPGTWTTWQRHHAMH
jgi:hypothetical protein